MSTSTMPVDHFAGVRADAEEGGHDMAHDGYNRHVLDADEELSDQDDIIGNLAELGSENS